MPVTISDVPLQRENLVLNIQSLLFQLFMSIYREPLPPLHRLLLTADCLRQDRVGLPLADCFPSLFAGVTDSVVES